MQSASRNLPFSFPSILMLVGASCVAGLAVGLTHQPLPTASARSAALTELTTDRSGRDSRPEQPAPESTVPYRSYLSTIALIKDHYSGAVVDEAHVRGLTFEAVRGMLGSLNDQFSSYLDPTQWKQLVTMTEGHFGGIGAVIEQASDSLKIAHPAAGGPADKAGLRAGDVLIAVDGKSVQHRSLDDLGQCLEGPPNSTVSIEVARGAIRLTVSIVREYIEPTIVEYWMEDDKDKIGHIVLTEFNRASVEQIESAYFALEKKGMRGLVLDLRFNPGGLLDAAVDVASIFIPENVKPQLHNNVVIIHHGDGDEEGLTLDPQNEVHFGLPLAVLVNGESASAAEIVTGAIRDYGVGVIVGERTFGKGKVQTLFEMNHGRDGGIRLTTSLYYPPGRYDINFHRDNSGNRIAGTGGIVPDLVVPASPAWGENFDDKVHDIQLRAAVQYLKAKLAGKTNGEATRIALGK